VVIPARGGSKGIKNKNLRLVGGKSLVRRAIDVAKQVVRPENIVVSTDSPKVSAIAKNAGVEPPFERPADLSGDFIADRPVLIHALDWMRNLNKGSFGYVCMLQPTCPLRQPAHIFSAFDCLVSQNADLVCSVSPVDPKYNPAKQFYVKNGLLEYSDQVLGPKIKQRQKLVPSYIRNGAVYIMRADYLKSLDSDDLFSGKVIPLVIENTLPNIDNEADLILADTLL